ncbi:hypothetical protein B0O99DRAFT_527752 [Bisporella sp. PMI_857]|nr:hypothetical protein B0O99DRAFT_527752 [Bisporella sp. PMI_857]
MATQDVRARALWDILGRKQSDSSITFQVSLTLAFKGHVSLSDRAGQCCFLCFERRKTSQCAVQVHCLRPTKPRRIKRIRRSKHGKAIESYAKLHPREMACESDAAIYYRLKDMYFQYQGKWKSWLPFYGITNVREVNFQFIGEVERDGRFPIHITPVNIDEVRKDADDKIALKPGEVDIAFIDVCVDNSHIQSCQDRMEYLSEPCIRVQIKDAERRKEKLKILHRLRDCAQDPYNASGYRTLEGMAQDSCIFDIE